MEDTPVSENKIPILKMPSEGIPNLIDSPTALAEATSALIASTMPAALDTERAQGRRYSSSAYLVQIRKDDVGTFIIDSHALKDLSSLQEALDTTWIFHAADQDLRCLTELGLTAPKLFDTETAARLVGYNRFSLSALTEQVLNISLAKTHQDEDWSRRPLPPNWLSYAALDVELLTELKTELTDHLKSTGRMEWAEQEFSYSMNNPIRPHPNTWRYLKGVGRLKNPKQMAVAKELWEVREEIGKKTDVAPSRILTPRAIVDAAILQPESIRELLGIETFRRPTAKRHIRLWWKTIERAYSFPVEKCPQKLVPDRNSVPAAGVWKHANPKGLLRLNEVRRILNETSQKLGVEAEVILEPRIQRELVWKPLHVDSNTPNMEKTISIMSKRLQKTDARLWQKELFLETIRHTNIGAFPALTGNVN